MLHGCLDELVDHFLCLTLKSIPLLKTWSFMELSLLVCSGLVHATTPDKKVSWYFTQTSLLDSALGYFQCISSFYLFLQDPFSVERLSRIFVIIHENFVCTREARGVYFTSAVSFPFGLWNGNWPSGELGIRNNTILRNVWCNGRRRWHAIWHSVSFS